MKKATYILYNGDSKIGHVFYYSTETENNRAVGESLSKTLVNMVIHSGQTQKTTSHPVASALKICISSKRLRSEVRQKVEIVTKQSTRR